MSEQVLDRPVAPAEAHPPIRTLDQQTVFRSRIIRHDIDLVEFPNGRQSEYSVIVPTEGYVAVAVPVATFRGLDYLGLVTQYRYPTKEVSVEFPRGGATAPSAEEAARELQEETGIVPGPAERLGTLRPDTGLLSTECAVYLFRQPATDMDIEFIEEESGARTSWHRVGEVMGMIRSGKITCGITIASFAQLMASGKLRGDFL